MRSIRNRTRDEDGAAAVEFALILPVLVLLVFGIIEFGMAFKSSLTVTSATRSGARTASALPRESNFHEATANAVARSVSTLPDGAVEELWIYKAGTNGYPVGKTSFDAGCSSCTVWDYDDANELFVDRGTSSWNPSSQNACAGTGDSVGIYVKMEHNFVTGLFGADMTITDHTVMRLEPKPAYLGCK
ncbi:MAG: TadE/TadG family type IV pilus assembly protein [Acidimicrobiia bacterium]